MMRIPIAMMLAFVLMACNDSKPAEHYSCTLFRTSQIPAAEDFPDYVACWGDQGHFLVFLAIDFYRIIDDGHISHEDINGWRLPNEWFVRETGQFIPTAFWNNTLGIIHTIDGVHDPCSQPDLVEYFHFESLCDEIEIVECPGPKHPKRWKKWKDKWRKWIRKKIDRNRRKP